MSQQNKKTALITGANRGIGFETARQLGQRNIKVLVGARSEKNGKVAEAKLKAEGFDAEFVLIDVDDAQTHESAAKHVEENYGKLDILINNAGIMIDEYENNAPVVASRTSDEIRSTDKEIRCRQNRLFIERLGFSEFAQRSEFADLRFQSSGLRHLENRAQRLCRASGLRIKRHFR